MYVRDVRFRWRDHLEPHQSGRVKLIRGYGDLQLGVLLRPSPARERETVSSEMGKGRVVSLPRGPVSPSLLRGPDSYSPLTSLLLRARAQSCGVRQRHCALAAQASGRMGSAPPRERAAARPLENTEEAADAARRCALARSVSILAK